MPLYVIFPLESFEVLADGAPRVLSAPHYQCWLCQHLRGTKLPANPRIPASMTVENTDTRATPRLSQDLPQSPRESEKGSIALKWQEGVSFLSTLTFKR